MRSEVIVSPMFLTIGLEVSILTNSVFEPATLEHKAKQVVEFFFGSRFMLKLSNLIFSHHITYEEGVLPQSSIPGTVGGASNCHSRNQKDKGTC